ncbi:MAG TPA: hypothetical protein VJP40_09470 [bacterium]|nr:hypothetical protein [bacterium]
MNIRKKLRMGLLGIGLLGISASAMAGPVVVGRPYGYGYPGFYPPPYAGYVPVAPVYGGYGGYPGYYSPNPALQNPGSPSNPAVLNYYMNGAPIPQGAVAPDPRFYSGGDNYYLY